MLDSTNRRTPTSVPSSRRKSTQPLKVAGEDAAAKFLFDKGFRLIARNWRTSFGEIDLIAMDGPTVVFVEVKARQVDRFLDPALAVNGAKQRRLRRLAGAFLAFEKPKHESCRFDVVSVVTDQDPIRIKHLPNAF